MRLRIFTRGRVRSFVRRSVHPSPVIFQQRIWQLLISETMSMVPLVQWVKMKSSLLMFWRYLLIYSLTRKKWVEFWYQYHLLGILVKHGNTFFLRLADAHWACIVGPISLRSPCFSSCLPFSDCRFFLLFAFYYFFSLEGFISRYHID